MIDFATQKDFDDIAQLWKLSFGDSIDYIKKFWDEMFIPKNTLVYRQEKKVVAMYFFLECHTMIKGEKFKSYYLYAAATSPDFRKQGIMSKLINEGINIAKSRGIEYIILVPASEHLYSYYSKFGFKTSFDNKVIELKRNDLLNLYKDWTNLSDCNYKSEKDININVCEIRNKELINSDYLCWNEKALKYAVNEHLYSGGKTAFTTGGYALYRIEKDTAYIKEICAKTAQDTGKVIGKILNNTDVTNFVFNLSVQSCLNSDNQKIENAGMIRQVNGQKREINNGYIGLSLG